MRVAMIPERVSGGKNLLRDLRTLFDVFPHHEERRLHIVAREHIKQVSGVGIVGSVVVSERQSLRWTRFPVTFAP